MNELHVLAAVDQTYRQILSVGNRVDATTVTGAATYGLAEQAVGTFSGSSGARGVFHLKPADLVQPGRTGKLLLRLTWMTNTVAPGITFVLGLYPVTGSPAAGATAVSATIGTVIAASVLTVATPAAVSGPTTVDTGDFSIPVEGDYAIGFTSSAAMAASSAIELRAQLLVRSV